MKTFCLIALMAVTAGTAARAQSKSNAAPQPPRVTHIDSDSADFDGIGHTVIYRGNVRVSDPELKLTCALLVANLPESGGHPNRVVAETNVVIDSTDNKGQTTHMTSDKAVYIYNVQNGVTNETVTLTGNAKVENAQGWMTGEPIVWNRANNSLNATDQHMVFRQSLNGVPANTNAPPAGTNELTAPKSNLPPGTIDNIDRINVSPKGGRGF